MTGTRIHLAIGACIVAALVVAGAAVGAPAPVKVKGTQTVINEAKGKFEMHGSLDREVEHDRVQDQLPGLRRRVRRQR